MENNNSKINKILLGILIVLVIAGIAVVVLVKKQQIPLGNYSGTTSMDDQLGKYSTYTASGFSFKYDPTYASVEIQKGSDPTMYLVAGQGIFKDKSSALWLINGPLPEDMNCSLDVAKQIGINGKEFHYCDSKAEPARLYYYSKNGKTLVVVTQEGGEVFTDLSSVEIN